MKKLLIAAAAVASVAFAGAAQASEALAKEKGCLGCHATDAKKMGPSFKEASAKYTGKADAEATIVGMHTAKALQHGEHLLLGIGKGNSPLSRFTGPHPRAQCLGAIQGRVQGVPGLTQRVALQQALGFGVRQLWRARSRPALPDPGPARARRR